MLLKNHLTQNQLKSEEGLWTHLAPKPLYHNKFSGGGSLEHNSQKIVTLG